MAGIFGSSTLFSAINGRVVLNGEPVSGARVEQSAALGGKSPVSHATETADDGSFQFEPIEKRNGWGSLFPKEFVVSQEIKISHDGRDYVGWIYTKRDPEPGSESGGRPFSVVCELGAEPDYTDNYYGVCRLVER